MLKRPKLCRSKFFGINFQINFMWTRSLELAWTRNVEFFFTTSKMYNEGVKSITCSSIFNILEHVIVKECFLFSCKHFLDALILVVRFNKVPW
jgi:hypothetical protein